MLAPAGADADARGGGLDGRAGAAGAAAARGAPATRSRSCRTPIPSFPSQLSPFLLFRDPASPDEAIVSLDVEVADLDRDKDADMA
jgi:hypothetical protein